MMVLVRDSKTDKAILGHIVLDDALICYTCENREKAIAPYVAAAEEARRVGLGLNAGHDLNTENLQYFIERIPWVDEVSIGHALISDALYWGLENTVGIYQRCISRAMNGEKE